MNPDDNSYDSIGEGLSDVIDEALRDPVPQEADEPRDAAWLRWLKFVAIIVTLATVFGLAFFCITYVMHYNSARFDLTAASQETGDQVTRSIKNWFWGGAGVGGGLGLIYVIRCLIRKVDP